MKTVPSLVASSTVGIAAAGLALGRPERHTLLRPSSKKRKAADLADVVFRPREDSSPPSRPATSSTVFTPEARSYHTAIASPELLQSSHTPQPRALNARTETPHNTIGQRVSALRSKDLSSPRDHNGDEHMRDSISSRGSWIKRLSALPLSQNNSPRSSVGPDSPSINLSHGSGAPILSNSDTSPAQMAPNKLVKRTTSGKATIGSVSRSSSGSQLPTLRRPATSHQRSMTLQQQFNQDTPLGSEGIRTASSEAAPIPLRRRGTSESHTAWRPYFESRPTRLTKERLSGRSHDGLQHAQSSSRRVVVEEGTKATLMSPELIRKPKTNDADYEDDVLEFVEELYGPEDLDEIVLPTIEPLTEGPHKRLRHSLSMHFSSPTSWKTRSGSSSGDKRNIDGRPGSKRYSSAPVSTLPRRRMTTSHGASHTRHQAAVGPAVFHSSPAAPETNARGDHFGTSFRSRSRNSSSPLPPLSRLSSFSVDLARLGLSSSSSSGPHQSSSSPTIQSNTAATSFSSTIGPISPTSTYSINIHARGPRNLDIADRASTLVGSDHEMKTFAQGDEDDMDFQSETLFDSLRSGATGSVRSYNTPLDSMFDEPLPTMNGHSKNKRQSIHEMMENGAFGDGSYQIVEEDEGASTPGKAARSSQDERLRTPVRRTVQDAEGVFTSSPPSFRLASKDFSRLSLDDEEEDEDWTRDDENMDNLNQLSPPSSSVNSRKVSPALREVLADLTHTGTPNGNLAPAERPKSNVFDWSEPSLADKVDLMGNSPRPRTAHVNQVADGRGGRAVGRRGPAILHVRSQSVPVVPDIAGQRDLSKLTSKFGTWGLGGKGVSEDWDNDFEFDNDAADADADDDSKMENSVMLVPPAIQASQASVVGHVGQIREVCLLVDDLKRLRLLGKEKGLLNGPSAPLWKEAEGIIALAVPDEEDTPTSTSQSPTSDAFDNDFEGDGGEEGRIYTSLPAPDHLSACNHQNTASVYDTQTVRRRSVFSPDDDIFGSGAMANSPPKGRLRSPSSPRLSSMKNSSEVARSVMERMHEHRSASDPLLPELTTQAANKMPFDTTSLRDLVHRANVLSRALAELLRKADGAPQSSRPSSPHRDSSPAFTRVFSDPMASPSTPKHLLRSESNNSILSGSIDGSPTRSLGQRMQLMTVV